MKSRLKTLSLHPQQQGPMNLLYSPVVSPQMCHDRIVRHFGVPNSWGVEIVQRRTQIWRTQKVLLAKLSTGELKIAGWRWPLRVSHRILALASSCSLNRESVTRYCLLLGGAALFQAALRKKPASKISRLQLASAPSSSTVDGLDLLLHI